MLSDTDANQFPISLHERSEIANARRINRISSRRHSPASTPMAEAALRVGGLSLSISPNISGSHFSTRIADSENTKHSPSSPLASPNAGKPLTPPGSR